MRNSRTVIHMAIGEIGNAGRGWMIGGQWGPQPGQEVSGVGGAENSVFSCKLAACVMSGDIKLVLRLEKIVWSPGERPRAGIRFRIRAPCAEICIIQDTFFKANPSKVVFICLSTWLPVSRGQRLPTISAFALKGCLAGREVTMR